MAKSQRSKRIKVSAGAPLVSKIKIIAKRDGRSVSGFIRKLIIDAVARAESLRPMTAAGQTIAPRRKATDPWGSMGAAMRALPNSQWRGAALPLPHPPGEDGRNRQVVLGSPPGILAAPVKPHRSSRPKVGLKQVATLAAVSTLVLGLRGLLKFGQNALRVSFRLLSVQASKPAWL